MSPGPHRRWGGAEAPYKRFAAGKTLQTAEFISAVCVSKKGPHGTRPMGKEAVELGLIDEIGGLSDALACLHRMVGEKDSGSASSP